MNEPAPPRDYARTYDIEIEQALLGSCLVNQKLIVHAAAKVRAEDLHDPLHTALFELMIEQDQAGKVVSPITLGAWLKFTEGFDQVGGTSYLAELALMAPAVANMKAADVAHIEQLGEILADLAQRRMALGAIDDARHAFFENKPAEQALADIAVVADEIAARRAQNSDETRSASEITLNLLSAIEKQAVSELSFSCPTGIRALDEIIGGLVPGNAIFIGGRPGMGKTIVGEHLCIAAARAGWEPDYWSLEMPGRELGARLICALDYEDAVREGRKPLEYDKLIQLRATGAELRRATLVNRNKLYDLPIKIFDFEDVTMARIAAISRARAAKAARAGKRKLFVIDHLGLIEPDERYRGRKVDELTLITKRTKQLAKRTGCPVVMLCQLNREVESREDKRPRIADFRDSGSIEQDADLLISLYRNDYYVGQKRREASHRGPNAQQKVDEESNKLTDILEAEVLKNRNGRTSTARCHINVAAGAICDESPVKERTSGDLLNSLTSGYSVPSEEPPLSAYDDELSKGAR